MSRLIQKHRKDTLSLIQRFAAQERRRGPFVAPCVRGGRVRISVDGLAHTLRPDPANFEGWGLFEAISPHVARVNGPADFSDIARWMAPLPTFSLRLVRRLRRRTWLAWPEQMAAFEQRIGPARPMPVHLVEDGAVLECVQARWDGGVLWAEGQDYRSDPRLTWALRAGFESHKALSELGLKGITPEMRTAWDLACAAREQRRPRTDEQRLRAALRTGGGTLEGFVDAGDHWQVHWVDRRGETLTSAISKGDLTVIASGICLDGHDREFDLQSLVGVVSNGDEDAFY